MRPRGASPAIYDAGGIRVAHLSYAYGFNGFVRPAGKEWLVDQIDPALILADAHAARAAGAELVVVSLHWGNEYVHEVVAAQQEVADALAADPGAVDLVVGHHAHVVQPISKVGSMWVVWGMGNLLSSNSPRCCTTEATDGVVVTVTIGDTAPGARSAVTGIAFTPTWNERAGYRVLPAEATLAAGPSRRWPATCRRRSTARPGTSSSLGGTELGVTGESASSETGPVLLRLAVADESAHELVARDVGAPRGGGLGVGAAGAVLGRVDEEVGHRVGGVGLELHRAWGGRAAAACATGPMRVERRRRGRRGCGGPRPRAP